MLTPCKKRVLSSSIVAPLVEASVKSSWSGARATPSIPWDEYWKALGRADVKEINVTAPKFLEGVEAVLKQEKPAALKSYLTWQVLDATAPLLSKAFVERDFANLRAILTMGGKEYAKIGTDLSTGPKLLSLDSNFRKPGIYEVAMGTPLEEVLYENPKIKEVAVVGVQPPKWPFQRVKAYVVLRDGAQASEDELKAYCMRRLEEYAVPWQIEFRKELPKNFVGKVVRRLLVEESANG